MKEPENIKAFNYLVLYILNKLYDNFPEKIDINPPEEVISLVIDTSVRIPAQAYPGGL